MDNLVKFFPMKDVVHGPGVAQIGAINRDPVCKRSDVVPLDLWIVKVVEIVDNRDLVAFRDQPLDKVGANKTGAARDENLHGAEGKEETMTRQGERQGGEKTR